METILNPTVSSGSASIKDIEKLYKKQKEMIFQPCKKLKFEVLNPTHYERMRESIAYDLISDEVSCALQFLETSNLNDIHRSESGFKISATSWILRFFNRYSTLMLKTRWTKNNFEENSSWLINEAIEIFESLKFEKSYLRCTTGAVIGILSTVNLIKYFLDNGIDEFNPEWLSNNSIENFFSQIVRFAPKPSALAFVRAAKSLSLSKYMQDSLDNTNYKWSHSNVSFCSEFLKILRKNSTFKCDATKSPCTDLSDIPVPDSISWQVLFSSNLEFNAFLVAMNELVEKFLTKIACDACKSRFLTYSSMPTEGNILLRMKNESPWEISVEVQCFLLTLEFIYRQLNCIMSCSDPSFNQIFINTVIVQIEVDFEHCQETIDKLVKVFVEFRRKLQFQSRFLHKKNNFASKNN